MRAVLPLALLAACAPTPPPAPAGPAFDPIAFFSGRTRGAGTLRIILRRDETLTVEGRGRVDAEGALILDQRVERTRRPAQRRRWVIRRTGPGRYAGTLTDAAGPVAGEARGNMLRLRFPMPGGFAAEQRLTLSPDGRTAQNRMTVRRFGIVVAHLDETIRRFP